MLLYIQNCFPLNFTKTVPGRPGCSYVSALFSYTKYPKVMAKHSVNGHLVSLILFMQFSTCLFGIHGNKHARIAIILPLTYIGTSLSSRIQ